MKRRIHSAALVAFVFGMSGCAATQDSSTASVNARCPMGREVVQASGGSATWKGMRVGFCCAMCEPLFEGLNDAEKAAALRAVGVQLD